MDIEIIDMAVGQIPTYGANGRYCLVEFPLQQVPLYVEQVFFSLQTKGITPIIAHPERYLAVVNDPNLVLHWIELGCAVQMNSGSILGRFGQKILETARILLSTTWCMFWPLTATASSEGRTFPRPCGCGEAHWSGAPQLVKGNPELIIKGEPISFAKPGAIRKRSASGFSEVLRFWGCLDEYVVELPMDQIQPGKNMRTFYREDGVQGLADSMEEVGL